MSRRFYFFFSYGDPIKDSLYCCVCGEELVSGKGGECLVFPCPHNVADSSSYVAAP